MPRYLAIDWDDSELRVASANIQGAKVSVDDLVSAPLGEGTNVEAALRELIATHKLKASEALVCAPRSAVELRSLTVPPVPEDELPDIVRFQALREFSELSDDWPIDYLPISATEDGITVKAASMSPQRLKGITKPIEACEVKLIGLVLRPTALVAITKQLNPQPGQIRLLVDQVQNNAELTVIDGVKIQMMRTIHLPPNQEQAHRDDVLVNEIQRTVFAAKNQCRLDVDTVVFFGPQDMRRSQVDLTRSKLNLQAECVNPLDSVSVGGRVALGKIDSGKFAAAIGMLNEQGVADNHTIDLIRPRKAVEPPSRRNLYTLLALAAVCIVGAGLFGVWYELNGLDEQINSLRQTANGKKAEAEQAMKRIEKVESIQHWEKTSMNVLTELERLSTQMPDADSVQLSLVQGTPDPIGNGKVTLHGLAKGADSLEAVVTNLTDRDHRVHTDNAQKSNAQDKYDWTFRETMTIVNVTEEEALARKNATRGRLLGRPRMTTDSL
ncbi:MAG: hypothetical protein KDB27_15195 [Planctomycetales bacterium]|nr:hypothetical protein [Planctomycetales bacterium]